MTRPRCLEPGQTYLITRRCTQRSFLLRPESAINNLLLYLLAVAAKSYDIELHAFAFLSNHYHLVLSETSEEVRLPEFMAWFNQSVARLVNILRGRQESVWAPGSYNAVVLIGEEAVMDKLVYTICNPVSSGLVEKPDDWRGQVSLPWMIESNTRMAEHPDKFFDQELPIMRTLPKKSKLTLSRPPCFRGQLGLRRFRALLKKKVEARLEEIYAQRERDGKGPFLGMKAVEAQDPNSCPSGPRSAPSLKPLVACKDPVLRREVLEGLRRFQSSYAEALKAWSNHEPEVEFPAGTYGVRVRYSAPCRSGPGVFPPR